MIADIQTIMWKETRSMFRHRGSRSRSFLTLMMPMALAIYLPWESGSDWVNGPVSLLLALAIPILVVGLTIPDSFAGERERHTLGTLLASRLPDRAILFGKIVPSVALAWMLVLLTLVLGLVVVNVVHADGELLIYSPIVITAGVGLSLLAAILTAAAGVLISLRIGTVQEASQMLMMALLLPPTVAGPLVMVVFKGRLKETFGGIEPAQALAVAAGVLALVSLALLGAAMARFQRERLILD